MSQPELTARESTVLARIRRMCARRDAAVIEAEMIGSRGTCESLARKGYITIELATVGPQGGRYYRYRLQNQDA